MTDYQTKLDIMSVYIITSLLMINANLLASLLAITVAFLKSSVTRR